MKSRRADRLLTGHKKHAAPTGGNALHTTVVGAHPPPPNCHRPLLLATTAKPSKTMYVKTTNGGNERVGQSFSCDSDVWSASLTTPYDSLALLSKFAAIQHIVDKVEDPVNKSESAMFAFSSSLTAPSHSFGTGLCEYS